MIKYRHNKPEVDLIFETYILNHMKLPKQNFSLSQPGDVIYALKLISEVLGFFHLWFSTLGNHNA